MSTVNLAQSITNHHFSSIAFFDLDRTILSINSGNTWVKSEYKQGYITRGQLIKALYWMTQYHLGWTDLASALLEAIRALEGTKEEAMKERVADFFKLVAPYIRSKAVEAIQTHKSKGDLCVLITTSSIYLARHFGHVLEFDHVLANHFEVHQGIFTGLPQGPLCFGEGKVTLAKQYVEALGLTPEHCSFYSDSFSDLPLLSWVGTPYVVTPDRKLKREAKIRKWDILNW